MEINIRDYVMDLDVPIGGTIRSDCPVCNGRNTFTVTKEADGGSVLYNCFKLSCELIPSIVPINLTASEIASRLSHLKETKSTSIPTFTTPEYVVYPELEHVLHSRFVARWDLELEDVLYDVKDSRAVFLIKDGHVVVDAIGRALAGAVPKWYRYTGNAKVFTRCIGEPSGVAVIVEDVISAITVAKVCPNVTGVAILGTNISNIHMPYLQDYTKIIVALDPDATRKGIEYRREIESWTGIPTVAMHLHDDLKYKTEEDLFKLQEYTI